MQQYHDRAVTRIRKMKSICKACGTQFPESPGPPQACPICSDPRQFIPKFGQAWTTLEELRAGHRNAFRQYEPNLIGIGTVPEFAIGQRAMLLRTPQGNFLWDCVTLIDDATVETISAIGGLRGITISHPHYYSAMLEWSAAFENAPIFLHAADREWVVQPGEAIEFWKGTRKELAPGITLIHCGGHFPGGTALHWAAGAEGRGALLSGDILQVGPDGMVSFMYSYPNLIPLPAKAVQTIAERVRPFSYDRIYGAWWDRVIETNAQTVVAESVARYVGAIAPG
jgi:glyoxylase-like metal-dependent hydrolase (beta-lactamase superfamily II)